MSRVYLVDDEEMCLEPTEMLFRAYGIPCDSFSSGQSLLDALDPNENAVVIADYRMPEMDGLELFESLRASSNNCPFVLLSGHADSEIVERALSMGVAECVLKPCQPKELVGLVQRLIGCNGASDPPA